MISSTFHSHSQTSVSIDKLGLGSITVSLKGISDINFPVQYKISSEPIKELKEEYLFLKETLKLNIDEKSFFQGKDKSNTKTFSELSMGDYHIAVFDNSGRRVFSDKVHLQAPLRFLQQENLALKNGIVSATRDKGSGELMLFLDSAATAVIDFKLSSVTDKTNSWFGFKRTKDKFSEHENMMYGFLVSGRRLHFIEENGVVSKNYSVLSKDDKLSINIMEDKVVYLQNGKEQHHVIRKNKEELNVVVGLTAEAHLEVQYDYHLVLSPYSFSLLNQRNLDCSGDGYGQFTFFINSPPYHLITKNPPIQQKFESQIYYSVKNLSTNTHIQSGQFILSPNHVVPIITVGSQSHPLEPGKYEISYSVTDNALQMSFLPVNRYVYIGYDASWGHVENYQVTNAPHSNSIERTINYDDGHTISHARADNVTSDERGWIAFDPKINNEPLENLNSKLVSSWNFLRVDRGSFGYNNLANLHIMLGKIPSGMPNPGAKIIVSGPSSGSQQHSISGNKRLIVEYTQAGLKIYEHANSQNYLIRSYPYTSMPNIYGLKTMSMGKNNGFLNVVTSFGCRKAPRLFAEPTRKINSTVYKVQDNKLYFYFDSEYKKDNEGRLNYKIYREHDRVTPVLSSSIMPEDDFYGDNRNILNVNLSDGNYLLVLENEKKEKFYLRFKK